jgi:hypothetical protein
MEVYKEIPFAKQYLVSDLGNVKSKRYDKPLKGSINSCGYLRVQLGCSKNKHFIHRLVAQCFLDKPKECDYVNHKDGNKTNNRLNNLEWVTSSQNAIHSITIGVRHFVKGEIHPQSILKDKEVVVIKKMLSNGYNCTYIAKLNGVSRKTISDIKNEKTWNHINFPMSGGLQTVIQQRGSNITD